MRKLIAALLLTISVPLVGLCAPHRKLTAIPRAVGRTSKNMVTFKDKQAAVEEWGELGATLADFVVSEHVLKTVPGSYEANPLFGKKPSLGRYLLIGIPFGMDSATSTQYFHESADGTSAHWLSYLGTGITVGVHSGAIAWNEHELRVICKQVGITC